MTIKGLRSNLKAEYLNWQIIKRSDWWKTTPWYQKLSCFLIIFVDYIYVKFSGKTGL